MLGTGLPRPDLTPGVSIPRLDEIGVDPLTLVATLAIATVTSILFGVVPIIRYWTLRPTNDLRAGGSSPQPDASLFRRHRARGLLVVGQMALAMLPRFNGRLGDAREEPGAVLVGPVVRLAWPARFIGHG
jgi:hypothetical protein